MVDSYTYISLLIRLVFGVGEFSYTHTHTYSERIEQTVSIDATTVDIEEKGVKLRLTVVDTPGFGDAVNNEQW